MSGDIGKRLMLVREFLAESQRSMSNRLGLGETTWQNLEREGRLPKTDALRQLADLGFSVDWILTGRGAMRPEPAPREAGSVSRHEVVIPFLVGALLTVEDAIRLRGVTLSMEEKARLAARLYADVAGRSLVELEGELEKFLSAERKVG